IELLNSVVDIPQNSCEGIDPRIGEMPLRRSSEAMQEHMVFAAGERQAQSDRSVFKYATSLFRLI
ncbi:MAG TPA: hypothetical protein VLQ20_13145, partial [Planococcus sp. (in: firmicutes)]|nr:hypothetical protein [Planococcus sp. (in: firmicutes)]